MQIQIGVIPDIGIIAVITMAGSRFLSSFIQINTENFGQTVLRIIHIFRLYLTQRIFNPIHIITGSNKQGIRCIPIRGLLPCIHLTSSHYQPATGFTFMLPGTIQAKGGMIHPLALRFPFHSSDRNLSLLVGNRGIPISDQMPRSVIFQIPLMLFITFHVRHLLQTNRLTGRRTSTQYPDHSDQQRKCHIPSAFLHFS